MRYRNRLLLNNHIAFHLLGGFIVQVEISYYFCSTMITTRDLLQLADLALQKTEVADWAADTFLNKEAIASSTISAPIEPAVEWHPLIPFLPKETRVLFLGSFPPQRKRWCMDFFYPNYINDHWRIEGMVFHGNAETFVDKAAKTFRLKDIVNHLKSQGIGFFDTAVAVRRLADNASDKFLEVVEPTDIAAMVEYLPCLRAIVTTGEKATETIATALELMDDRGKVLLPKVGTWVASPFHNIELYRLPSSSRAYPLSLSQKAEAYESMFHRYLSVPVGDQHRPA